MEAGGDDDILQLPFDLDAMGNEESCRRFFLIVRLCAGFVFSDECEICWISIWAIEQSAI